MTSPPRPPPPEADGRERLCKFRRRAALGEAQRNCREPVDLINYKVDYLNSCVT